MMSPHYTGFFSYAELRWVLRLRNKNLTDVSANTPIVDRSLRRSTYQRRVRRVAGVEGRHRRERTRPESPSPLARRRGGDSEAPLRWILPRQGHLEHQGRWRALRLHHRLHRRHRYGDGSDRGREYELRTGLLVEEINVRGENNSLQLRRGRIISGLCFGARTAMSRPYPTPRICGVGDLIRELTTVVDEPQEFCGAVTFCCKGYSALREVRSPLRSNRRRC